MDELFCKPYALYFSDPQSSAPVQWAGLAENPDHALHLGAGDACAEIGHGCEDEYSPERLCWCVFACIELADVADLDAFDDPGGDEAWAAVQRGENVTPGYCQPREVDRKGEIA